MEQVSCGRLNRKRRQNLEKGVRAEMGEVDDVIRMLDNMAKGGVSRIKVETSEEVENGAVRKAYHHGRCDVGSPFAAGKLFDAEESDCG